MGSWGPGLYQNDVADDVRSEFIGKLHRGETCQAATQALLEKYNYQIDDVDDRQAFWLSLADIQWKYGCLDQSVKAEAMKVIDMIPDCQEYGIWNPQSRKRREKVLQDLKIKLNSPQPELKKIKPQVLFKCEWKIGDVYALKLESEEAKQQGLLGRYILIIKVDECNWYPGHQIPVIYTKITKTEILPETIQEINDSMFVLTTLARGKNEYRMIIITTSKRGIPVKKLKYLGNFASMDKPQDEFIVNDSINSRSLHWNEMESVVVKNWIWFR